MNRLKELREKKGLGQKAVAIDIGVSQATISDWESGRKVPSSKSTSKLADYYDVSIDYLLGRSTEEMPTTTLPLAQGYTIPILGKVAAGVPIEAITDYIGYVSVSEQQAKSGDFFALKADGDSMFPDIKDGDVVIAHKQDDVNSNDIAVVFVNGYEATCKRIVKSDAGIMLVALNQEVFSPVFYTWEEVASLPVKIMGKVVESRKQW